MSKEFCEELLSKVAHKLRGLWGLFWFWWFWFFMIWTSSSEGSPYTSGLWCASCGCLVLPQSTVIPVFWNVSCYVFHLIVQSAEKQSGKRNDLEVTLISSFLSHMVYLNLSPISMLLVLFRFWVFLPCTPLPLPAPAGFFLLFGSRSYSRYMVLICYDFGCNLCNQG